MAEKTWLYIYENKQQQKLYIGIAKNMDRVYQGHNKEAESLRDASGTVILQTPIPFSSREDALKAEAIAIHVASFMNTEVIVNNDEEIDCELFHDAQASVTNIAGRRRTKHLVPAIFTRPGSVEWASLSETLIVPIKADEIEGKVAPFGGHKGAIFSERAREFWQVNVEKRKQVKHLMAVLRGRNIILGSWQIDHSGKFADTTTWTRFEESPIFDPILNKHRATAISIPLVNPDEDDFMGIKGKALKGCHLNQGVTYSPDLKKQ